MKRLFIVVACMAMVAGCVTQETIFGSGENMQQSSTAPSLGLECVEGNCFNGKGKAREDLRKYKAIHQGDFKDGKLWDGEVVAIRGGSTRVIMEIVEGTVVYDSSKVPLR